MKRYIIVWFAVLLVGYIGFADTSNRIQPGDLTYLGAFRLPEGTSDIQSWAWGGYALTHYPGGDPTGAADGFPGSLFGTGHAWQYQVSELSIPVPVISPGKNLNELNTATTLQGFQDIFNVGSVEMPRIGLAYLPRQGSQASDKLYYCMGMHLNDNDNFLTHGWFDLTLSSANAKGRWALDGPYDTYNTNDYMFEIPASWASANTPGKILATGRYRDGGWSGQGPALFAIGPWNQGNPPAAGTTLQYVELLRYSSSYDEGTTTMSNYHHSDEWSGAVWLTAGNQSAVVFLGTKGTGECWYGNSEGPCLSCEDRGWWSTGFIGQMIFYDPDDLAKVAGGLMQPWEPQPYATLNVDQYLYHLTSTQEWYHLGAAAFDRDNGFLYVMEPFADGENDRPIVHVWKVNDSGSGGGGGSESGEIAVSEKSFYFGGLSNGTVSGSRKFIVSNSGTGKMIWSLSENAGWLSCTPGSGTDWGEVTVSVNPTGLTAGQYSVPVRISSADAVNSPQTVMVNLTVYSNGNSSEPFGQLATPLNNTSVNSSIAVTGWVLDDIGVENIKIYRVENGSSVFIGDAVMVEGSRPDVKGSYPYYPGNHKAGWGYMLLTNFLPNNGNGTFTLSAVAHDLEGNIKTLGSATINCDNANAVKPFGAIDTPSQGGTASGSSFINWGWVLTPLPNSMATDGSTINVWVDGVMVGHPTYNIYRQDIATLFPSYANSSGAIGYFILDTTAYSNGVHTIQWTATDSAGNTDGIGSRYFIIDN